MRRYRRLVLIDRLIPFLAAIVGLVALAGAVAVQLNTDAKTKSVTDAVVALQASVEALGKRADALAVPAADDGTAAGLLALQDRMVKLESEWTAQQAATAAAPATLTPGDAPATAAEIDPNLPTTDCIPLGTRFMASVGDEMKICQSPVVIKVSAITGDSVLTENAGVVNETASAIITGSNCRLQVFTADAEGFAEMRVSCN
jgi:acyl-CoA synthetase (AMP-forming)/AMP-acid ligase II